MNQQSKQYLATEVIKHMGLEGEKYEKRLWNFFKKLPTKILLNELPEEKRRFFRHSVKALLILTLVSFMAVSCQTQYHCRPYHMVGYGEGR